MGRRIIVFIAAIVLSTGLSAVPAAGEVQTDVHLDTGYRTDELYWNIAGDINGENPNVLSELKWTDLKIYQLRLALDILVDRHCCLRASAGYGKIVGGDNQDSDYLGDDRTYEFSRSNNDAGDGSVLDLSVGFGYRYRPADGPVTVTPMVGYSQNEQHLTMTDGYQTLDPYDLVGLGSFSGLDSTYDATWKGPWVGLDLSYDMTKALRLYGAAEYHMAEYEAEANWNLREEFAHPKSFVHDADGTGVVLSGGIDYALRNVWSVGLTADYQVWRTDSGLDTTFFSDSSAPMSTQLNEVHWTSYAVMLRITYLWPGRSLPDS